MASTYGKGSFKTVRKETRCRHYLDYSFRIAERVLLYVPSHRQNRTSEQPVTPVVELWLEQEIAQWVHHEGSIWWSIAPWANTLTTGLHLAPSLQEDRQSIDCTWWRSGLNLRLMTLKLYFWLCGVRHMVKDHSDSEKGNPLPPHRLLFPINSKGSFICTIPQTG